jgi:hypothetical protein
MMKKCIILKFLKKFFFWKKWIIRSINVETNPRLRYSYICIYMMCKIMQMKTIIAICLVFFISTNHHVYINSLPNYCSVFSSFTFGCYIIILFFNFHFNNKIKYLWKFGNKRRLLLWHIAPLFFLSIKLLINFVDYHFWLKLLQEHGYLFLFTLNSLISCDAFKSVFFHQFFFEILNMLPKPKNKSDKFLHGHVKSSKCICFTFTLFYMT